MHVPVYLQTFESPGCLIQSVWMCGVDQNSGEFLVRTIGGLRLYTAFKRMQYVMHTSSTSIIENSWILSGWNHQDFEESIHDLKGPKKSDVTLLSGLFPFNIRYPMISHDISWSLAALRPDSWEIPNPSDPSLEKTQPLQSPKAMEP